MNPSSIQSLKLQSLDSERSSLKKQINDLEDRQDFWNSWYLGLGAAAIIFAVVLGCGSWICQKQASNNSYKARPLTERLSIVDGRIREIEKSVSDLAVAKAQATASEAASHAQELEKRNIALKGRLDKESEESRRKFEEQRKQNLDTEARLTEANKSLEEEREKRLEMEARIAPRRLEGARRAQLIELLRPLASPLIHPEFVGKLPKITIFSVMNDAESGEYALALVKAMREARWNVVDGVGQIGFNVPAPRGVRIEISPGDSNDPLLEALAKSFKRIGIDASGVIVPIPPGGVPDVAKGTARIIVGFKPQPSK